MSEHEDIREQLSAYLDGELSAGDARRVESALADDAKLADELEQLRKTRRLLQSLLRERVGEDFTANVMRAAMQKGPASGDQPWRPASLPNPWRRYLAAAALIVFAVGLGIFFSITLYDAGPGASQEEMLAIRSPAEVEDVESYGVVARDLDDLRDATMKKPEERAAGIAKTGRSSRRSTIERKTATRESRPPGTPEMMLESPSAASPPEAPMAKAAPTSGKKDHVAGKGGVLAGEELTYVGKGGRDENEQTQLRTGSDAANTQTNRPPAILIGTQSTVTLVSNVTPEDNEVIYTDDLAAGRKQVEAVLLANAFEITPPSRRQLQPNQANLLPSRLLRLDQNQRKEETEPQQLQYVVYGTPGQLQCVRVQLQRDIAGQATVQRGESGIQTGNQIQTVAQTMPVVDSIAKKTDAKESKIATTQQVRFDLSLAQQPTTQAANQGLAGAPRQGQPESSQSRQQMQQQEGLIRNQAMLITLKVRPVAKK